MFSDPPSLEAEGLSALLGRELPASVEPDTHYRVERTLGAGSSGVAFYATRIAPNGQSPVVVKVVRPSFILGQATQARLMVQKESVALGRLNEMVPPCPFIVRLLDHGVVAARHESTTTEVPWLALEHVHGGPEGTTLAERVEYSVRHTGHGFDPARAAQVLDCVARGVDAIHGVDVIHRDISPRNVLCRGFGDTEEFMIADFGIARPVGVAATFGGVMIGTPGYSPPEQAGIDPTQIGPWSDVFGLGAMIYLVLTGEDYFDVRSISDALLCARRPERKRLETARSLPPALRANLSACRLLDGVLARATSAKPSERPQSGGELARLVLPVLRTEGRRSSSIEKRLSGIIRSRPLEVESWSWSARCHATGEFVVRDVSWSGSGGCLAATSRGLAFWSGTKWLRCTTQGLPKPDGIRFVERVAPGSWLLGCDGASLAAYSSEGVREVVTGDPAVSFTHADGDLEDLAVIAGAATRRPPLLYGMTARRWLKPLELGSMSRVTALARVDDSRWLVVGRDVAGNAAALLYSPLLWEAEVLPAPEVPALLACASGATQGALTVAVGSRGAALILQGGRVTSEFIRDAAELSSVTVDLLGHAWAAGAGRLWRRTAPGTWRKVWQDDTWTAPIISLDANAGLVLAVSADGGVLEGRMLT